MQITIQSNHLVTLHLYIRSLPIRQSPRLPSSPSTIPIPRIGAHKRSPRNVYDRNKAQRKTKKLRPVKHTYSFRWRELCASAALSSYPSKLSKVQARNKAPHSCAAAGVLLTHIHHIHLQLSTCSSTHIIAYLPLLGKVVI